VFIRLETYTVSLPLSVGGPRFPADTPKRCWYDTQIQNEFIATDYLLPTAGGGVSFRPRSLAVKLREGCVTG